jgi:glycosyltransferase involved in cell wall biosynthesis
MQIQNRDFIIFGDDWGIRPQTLEHLAKIIVKYNRVLWVNSIGNRRVTLSKRDFLRLLEKIRNAFKRKKTTDENINFVKPLAIPFHDSRIVRIINGWILKRLVNNKKHTLGFKNPIVITVSPVVVEAIGRLGEVIDIFYCIDEYTGHENALKNMAKIEEELLRKSDIAFFVSEKLLLNKAFKPKHSYTVTQGVDYEHFSVMRNSLDDPFKDIKKPLIGFMGWITSWVDVDLIAKLARQCPEYSFVMIGDSSIDLSSYHGIHNLHFPGPVPYKELPRYAQRFDAGLIPFKLIPITIASNPLKLFEYFSLGIPVISTPLPEVMKYQPLVDIAQTVDEFSSALKKHFTYKDNALAEQRRELAKKYSWMNVVEKQLEIIYAVLEEKA